MNLNKAQLNREITLPHTDTVTWPKDKGLLNQGKLPLKTRGSHLNESVCVCPLAQQLAQSKRDQFDRQTLREVLEVLSQKKRRDGRELAGSSSFECLN